MRFDWSTLALQTINFAILVWLLRRFLYQPVLQVIDARRAEVEKQFAEARSAEEEVEARIAAAEAERAKIAVDREAILTAAAAQAEEAAKERAARAQRDAATVVAEAHRLLGSERQEVLAEAKRVALDIGLDIARQLLAEAPTAVQAEGWLDQVEQHLAALPQTELDSLKRQLTNGAGLRVVTAAPLSDAAAGTWRTRLHRLVGNGIDVSFELDPALIAGAELHFPSAILRFSWQSALSALRTEIGTHDGAD